MLLRYQSVCLNNWICLSFGTRKLLAIGTRKHLRYLEIHMITAAFARNVFHSSTHLLDVAKSRFLQAEEKNAWNTWNHFGELTTPFSSMSLLPLKLEDITNHTESIE